MLNLSDFDFDLPEKLIALRPAVPRSASRMLVSDADGLHDSKVVELGSWLREGDLLVFNNTKVIPSRLNGTRTRDTTHGTGVSQIEATMIQRISGDTWRALAKPLKRLAVGDVVVFGDIYAEVMEKSDGQVELKFSATGDALDESFRRLGQMPLPPYIASKRPADAQDMEDYQTVFAKETGAVAAPTASLHFDAALLQGLAEAGVKSTEVTLHVGTGTFLPVKTEVIAEHKMHSEWGAVSEQAAADIAETLKQGGRVIPVGTTALRIIETAAQASGEIAAWSGDTDIFITPGFEFKVTSALMTNFHLPKSTLLMLVAALVGMEKAQDIYAHALSEKYRFFSYGDSSLLIP
ncbi:MAG TPA: tRNA preQ1(34) S-adenosylmethionine ribosyltransferase-isomerase QueA [Rhodobacteraceae bacterium]|nr:tRNA preQ1(34) S-adenosylmethionine ribosyltransferase-isomerase QueA [Paracoccaceae bacterium]